MQKSIALIEFSKIAVAIKCADEMTKAADIDLLETKFICPGKYSVLIGGKISAVKSSLNTGLALAEREKAVIEKLLIPKVSEEVLEMLKYKKIDKDKIKSLGVLEYNNISSGIIAADTAVKAAEVHLVKLKLGMTTGGKAVVIFTGDNQACQHGINACKSAVNDKYLISESFISSPSKKLIDSVF